ncbi:MAG: AAA family ATPase, partial [Blastocatellia bacterium]
MRKPSFTYECALKAPDKPFPKAHDKPEPYIASEPLKRAVNLAIALERPLLVEGEAGCGKSRLARAVAYELGLPLLVWNVRSTSKAVEGLYGYDAILRLHDVQVQQRGGPVAGRDPQRATDNRKFGPLGDAFRLESSPGVVLIDEIDKADL